MLQIPVKSLSPDWHVLRQKHIGASEIATLLGVNPYETIYSLYHRKKGNIARQDLSDNRKVQFGIEYEEAAVKLIARFYNLNLIQPTGCYATRSEYGIICTPDALVVEKTEAGREFHVPLQIKHVDKDVFRSAWKSGDKVNVPLNYQAQMQQEIFLVGGGFGYLGVIVGGNEEHLMKITLDMSIVDLIRKKSDAFWVDFKDNKEPDVTAQDLALIYKLNPITDDQSIDLSADADFYKLALELHKLKEIAQKVEEKAKEIKERQDTIKANLMEKIGGNKAATCRNFIVGVPEVTVPERVVKAYSYRRFTLKTAKEEKI